MIVEPVGVSGFSYAASDVSITTRIDWPLSNLCNYSALFHALDAENLAQRLVA